jgi:hypothetical protein
MFLLLKEVVSREENSPLTQSHDRANDRLAEATGAIVAGKTAAEVYRAETQQGEDAHIP